MYKIFFSPLLIFFFSTSSHAQSNKHKAVAKGREAVKLMDKGDFKGSMNLLKDAQKLDPDNIIYPYEIAYCEYEMQDYDDAIRLLEKLLKHEDLNDRVYQLLGNSYDMLQQREKAIQIYEVGLDSFPRSGILHLERGNMSLVSNDESNALKFYENGIKADRGFPSNYYRATQICLKSDQKLWGMIYGEIFLNLERKTERATEVSRLLYNAYINNDTSKSGSFGQNIGADQPNELDSTKSLLGFSVNDQIMKLVSTYKGIKPLNLNDFDSLRSRFLDLYFEDSTAARAPNALFEYQKKIKEAGHFEAYNYMMLKSGNESEFKTWISKHKHKWDAFMKWLPKNEILLDETSKFQRSDY